MSKRPLSTMTRDTVQAATRRLFSEASALATQLVQDTLRAQDTRGAERLILATVAAGGALAAERSYRARVLQMCEAVNQYSRYKEGRDLLSRQGHASDVQPFAPAVELLLNEMVGNIVDLAETAVQTATGVAETLMQEEN